MEFREPTLNASQQKKGHFPPVSEFALRGEMDLPSEKRHSPPSGLTICVVEPYGLYEHETGIKETHPTPFSMPIKTCLLPCPRDVLTRWATTRETSLRSGERQKGADNNYTAILGEINVPEICLGEECMRKVEATSSHMGLK
ncbi:unnamed protein product [Arctogadus glacialis]